MAYSRRILKYLEKIESPNLTHLMSVVDHMAINVETIRIGSRGSLDKEFTKLIPLNP